MARTAEEMNKFVEFAKQAKSAGYSAQEVDSFLRSKGSSLEEVGAAIKTVTIPEEELQKFRDADDKANNRNAFDRWWMYKAAPAIADFFGKNKTGRVITSAIQGANKGNPLVQLASLVEPTVNDNLIEPENGLERAVDLGLQFAVPAGITAKAADKLVKAPKVAALLGKSKAGRFVANALTASPMPIEYGAAAGAGALTGAVNPETTVGKIATGVAGGIAGGALAGALSGALKAGAKNAVEDTPAMIESKAYKSLEKHLGKERLEEAIKTAKENGVPLMDIGSENINQVARTARSVSPDANEMIAKRYETIQNNMPSTVSRKLDEIFGSTNADAHAKQLAESLDPMANVEYENAFTGIREIPGESRLKTYDTVLPSDKFKMVMRDPYIKRAVNEAPSVHLEVANAKPNTYRRLDYAKEMLDSRIGHEMAKPDGERNMRLVASLQNAKKYLVDTLDEANPTYKSARGISQQKLSALEAQRYGAKIDRADISADAFTKRVADMSERELEGLRVGIREHYKKGFEQAENPAVFAKRLLDVDAQKKLRAALPAEEADSLISFARTIHNQNRSKNFVMGGSRTAENQVGIADAVGGVEEIANNPIKAPLKKVARGIDNAKAKKTYARVAELLLADPKQLQIPKTGTEQLRSKLPKMPANATVYPVLQALLGGE